MEKLLKETLRRLYLFQIKVRVQSRIIWKVIFTIKSTFSCIHPESSHIYSLRRGAKQCEKWFHLQLHGDYGRKETREYLKALLLPLGI